MNREQFFGKLAALDDQRLKKALWNLYWRGSAAIRERIEAEIDPDQHDHGKRPSKELVDPQLLLGEVADFAALARSGAYMAGDRRVSPRERTRWRLTFKRLVGDAEKRPTRPGRDCRGDRTGAADRPGLRSTQLRVLSFRGPHGGGRVCGIGRGRAAVGQAASPVRVCWLRATRRAAAIRWESRYGWTRSGYGRVGEKETSLASVLARMLSAPDMWVGFTDRYLDALDRVTHDDSARPSRTWPPMDRSRDRRTADLAEWHCLLLDRLVGSEAEDRLDRLASHPALGGPELEFVKAQLAHRRGDLSSARSLVHTALEQLPGHQDFLDFAAEIGGPLPPRAQQIARER